MDSERSTGRLKSNRQINDTCAKLEGGDRRRPSRVVLSRIPNLERKRGQYQDFGFVRAKR